MSRLNERQRSFVVFFVIHGNAAQACKRAGYCRETSTAETFAKAGYQLLQKDSVRAAVMEETRKRFHSAASAAVRVYHQVLESPTAKHADKLRAAGAVMRGLIPSPQVIAVQHEHHHRHTLTATEVTKRILELAGRVSMWPPCRR
jgi:phage terminase small subunit